MVLPISKRTEVGSMTFVYCRGEWQIAQYCNGNGGPRGQGAIVRNFLRCSDKVDSLRAVIRDGYFFEPTLGLKRDFIEDAKWAWEDRNPEPRCPWVLQDILFDIGRIRVGDIEDTQDLYVAEVCQSLSVTTGAKILEYAAEASTLFPIVKTLSFPEHVTWAYVIDLDKDILEVFARKGRVFGHKVIENHRFDEVEWAKPNPPVYCVGTFELDKIPNHMSFVAALRERKPDTEATSSE